MQEFGTLEMCIRLHFCGERPVIDGRFALITPLYFVVSMLIIPPILYNAQALAVVPKDVVRDPDRLPEYIENLQLTNLFIVPSMLKHLKRIPASLTKISLSEENRQGRSSTTGWRSSAATASRNPASIFRRF